MPGALDRSDSVGAAGQRALATVQWLGHHTRLASFVPTDPDARKPRKFATRREVSQAYLNLLFALP